jgi:hypothetical protein
MGDPLALLALLTGVTGEPTAMELAGKPLESFPHFQVVRAFNRGDPIRIAFDPRRDAFLAGRRVDVFLLAHDALPAFLAGRKLTSLAGAPLTLALGRGDVRENTFLLEPGTLHGTPVPDAQGTFLLGRGYDVAVDVDGDGRLGAGDLLDGSRAQAGFYVLDDFLESSLPDGGRMETGPYRVREELHDFGLPLTKQDIYFPEEIGRLGALPLVVVSHGNGHNYQWYDHIGDLMASFGYVVVSHATNTGPGPDTAATSTLQNTELFLSNLASIAGGMLVGHVDGHRMVWIGHSRGAQGVVLAHKRLSAGDPLAVSYGPDDVRLVSSIAPTDFGAPTWTVIGETPFHLWTAGADGDVSGCPSLAATFPLFERATGPRFSTSVHGAGHGDFHAGNTPSVAVGPCLIHRKATHLIVRGIFLPLVQWVLDANPPCLDFLTRQYEEFRPLGAPAFDDPCVSVDLMYLPPPESGRFFVDDFQSEPDLGRSSSGGSVLASPALDATRVEGLLHDADFRFTPNDADPMNGMTLARTGDVSAGTVFEWNGGDEWLLFEVPPAGRDLRGMRVLSFRAAQCTRHALTLAEEGDLDFEVTLSDAALRSSTIRIGAYGGGIEEPYARGGCGEGVGWANDFETIRIPLADFRRGGRPLDLGRIVAVTLRFGPAHGSPLGRIGFDELAFTRD